MTTGKQTTLLTDVVRSMAAGMASLDDSLYGRSLNPFTRGGKRGEQMSVAPDKAHAKRVRKRKLQRQARRIERLHRKH